MIVIIIIITVIVVVVLAVKRNVLPHLISLTRPRRTRNDTYVMYSGEAGQRLNVTTHFKEVDLRNLEFLCEPRRRE